MLRAFAIALVLFTTQSTGYGQDPSQGKFCLTYQVQPIVEAYIDSLQGHLRLEFERDSIEVDSVTEDYIQHFSTMITRKEKCVYFHPDSILIQEVVADRATNTYLILPNENQVVYRLNEEIKVEPYFLGPEATSGTFDYELREDRSDTKLIEGLPCYRLEIIETFNAPDSDPLVKKYVAYVTDAIPINGNFILGINMNRAIGCPLEIQEPLNEMVRISYQAHGLNFQIPDNIFQSF
ncbi:MAG: hypothetical protein OEM26_10960 [Saprospiraceae bacterium]|nr:hypothetical protein [Saprospiraceae bacterium]